MITRLTNDKNIYKTLVQTSDNKLPTPDIPQWNGVSFKKEAVEGAIAGLKGKMVYDNTLSAHAQKANKTNNKIFAQVIDTEFDQTTGNAYAYLDVFDEEYIPLMDKLIENYESNIRLDEGFSTELKIKSKAINPDNSAEITDYGYTGLVFINNPRDYSGVEGKIVNSIIPNDVEQNLNNGGINMGDTPNQEPLLTKEEYKQITKENADLKAEKKLWKSEKESMQGEIDGYKSDISKKDEEIKNLNNSISTYKEGEKTRIETLTNSILERVPEENRDTVKKTLEGKDLDTLELINSMGETNSESEEDNTLNNGFAGITQIINKGKEPSKKGLTDYEKSNNIDMNDIWGKLGKNEAGGT